MAFTEDLSVFFNAAEFAVSATFTPTGEAPITASVMLDRPDEDVLGGRASSTEYQMTLPTATFPGIARGMAVVIAGEAYQVREVRVLADGAIKTVTLSKA